jgi:hypothetical protein
MALPKRYKIGLASAMIVIVATGFAIVFETFKALCLLYVLDSLELRGGKDSISNYMALPRDSVLVLLG